MTPLTAHQDSRPWYVCQTKPRQEQVAMRKLAEQGYEVFLPMLTQWERKKSTWHRLERVMFPRYSFVRCGRSEQGISPIRSTPGVSDLVRFGTTLALLDAETVNAIRTLAEQGNQALQAEAMPFKVGEQVEVADGPLKGLAGIVSEVAEKRVVVLLTLLGREKPIAMPANHLCAGKR